MGNKIKRLGIEKCKAPIGSIKFYGFQALPAVANVICFQQVQKNL